MSTGHSPRLISSQSKIRQRGHPQTDREDAIDAEEEYQLLARMYK